MARQGTCQVSDTGSAVGTIELCDKRHGEDNTKTFTLWDNVIFKIGRDPTTNTLAIEGDSNAVSRNHCEVYVIMYEPTVYHFYVRDRKSSNGTYVNGRLVGRGQRMSSGYLLGDGDIIEIRPYWKFYFNQTTPSLTRQLTVLQIAECKLFEKRYKLTERCLGYGSQAAAHLSVDVKTKKQLVCKLVNLSKARGRDSCIKACRKYQEADILRQLQHPNILPYVDAVKSPHTLYTFTELASGGDLMSFANRHNFVTEFDTRIIIRQVIHGLRYLHAKGIVHRDLKPENILLAFSPKIAYHRIMLADFGASAVPQRNRMTTMVGTACYQAPEIHDSSQVQTAAVDIWSLGMVALMLLSTSGRVDIGDLSRLDQTSIHRALDECFQSCGPPWSADGCNFIKQCLRVAAGERLTSDQAGRHNWLCTPEKHLEFFRSLDKFMMAEYCPQSLPRPLPLELPDLQIRSDKHGDVDQEASLSDANEVSRYFKKERAFEHTCSQARPAAEEDPRETGLGKKSAAIRPLSPARKRTPLGQVEVHPEKRPLIEEVNSDIDTVPWESLKTLGLHKKGIDVFVKPKPIIKYGRKHKAMRKRTRHRYNDAMFLPPTDLSRHTNPAAGSKQRERILSKLGKTKTKFIA